MTEIATDTYAPLTQSWYGKATATGTWSALANYSETMTSTDKTLKCAIPSDQGQSADPSFRNFSARRRPANARGGQIESGGPRRKGSRVRRVF